uniref:Uncharacterized protein AlNc14C287G10192 n=1 Tax=Albugo laibachii Nc14 TaxID=890382 RepID=F0WV48_9STRA|nr:sporangia induced hypothetical protein [Albugo laibachii Nc14]|eukprot:CCA25286.1 sporangia induced hypothetical protein [Albugo laibachii Nc14]
MEESSGTKASSLIELCLPLCLSSTQSPCAIAIIEFHGFRAIRFIRIKARKTIAICSRWFRNASHASSIQKHNRFIAMDSVEMDTELNRLRMENRAKDETLHQLKLKTKAFVDSMRKELAIEKAKVAQLSDTNTLENELETSKKTCERLQQQLRHSQSSIEPEKIQQLTEKHQQYKIEIEHLQKQLLDRDFQLEQLPIYRDKLATQEQITAQTQEVNASLQSHLNVVSRSYESEQPRIMELQDALANSQSKFEILERQLQEDTSHMARMQDQLRVKETQVLAHEKEMQQLRREAQASHELEEAQAKYRLLENDFELLKISSEGSHKEELSKRQKAKTLVLGLSADKQALLDQKDQQQREIDRLRMELNQKNVENERRVKQLNENSQQKLVQAASSVHELTDEIQILKQTLHVLQESEKSQQRARELATAKREVEESNKKRLAAKAETQKLAIELESLQKIAQQHNLTTETLCRSLVLKLGNLAERVQEALQILEKRMQKPTTCSDNQATEEVRHPEMAHEKNLTTRAVRGTAFNQQSFLGIDTAEQSLMQLQEKLSMVAELTEKLCEVSMDQQEVSLKEVVKTRLTQFVTQCFAEKVRQAYTKVDEGTESLFESAKASVHSSS